MAKEVLTPAGDLVGPAKDSWAYPIFLAAYGWYRRNSAANMREFRIDNFNRIGSYKASQVGDVDVVMKSVEMMGSAVLKNSSSEQQTMKTGEFNKEIQSSWSTTATNTRDFGMEAGGSVEFGPKLAKFKIELKYLMNFSYSKSDTKSGYESISYSLPSQEIVVPPNSTRYVYAMLQKGEAAGNMDIFMKLNANYTSSGEYQDRKPVSKKGDAYSLVKEMYPYVELERISLDDGAQAVCYADRFKFVISAAFSVVVEVYDKPKEFGGQLLERKLIEPERLHIAK